MQKKIEIIKSLTYFDVQTSLVERLKNTGENLEEEHFIFCEEKLTLSIEKNLCESFCGSFNKTVFSFDHYLKLNSQKENILSVDGSTLIMRKIINDNLKSLRCFSKKYNKNLPSVLFELICQLKSAKVSPQEIENSLQFISGALSDKLFDISLVFKKYEEFIFGKYLDQNTF